MNIAAPLLHLGYLAHVPIDLTRSHWQASRSVSELAGSGSELEGSRTRCKCCTRCICQCKPAHLCFYPGRNLPQPDTECDCAHGGRGESSFWMVPTLTSSSLQVCSSSVPYQHRQQHAVTWASLLCTPSLSSPDTIARQWQSELFIAGCCSS